jgi:hypothetical protein
MTRRSTLLIGTILAAALVAVPGVRVSAQAGNWTTLFDGKTLKGWNMVGGANWQVVDGTIQADKGMAGFLVTPVSYGDFQMQVEFWVDADANSGVFIRCEDPKSITAMNAYEVNIYDKRPDPTYRTGAIVDVSKPLVNIDAGGKWNTFDITARGTKLTVVMNGMKTVDADDKKHARGPIALQWGAGTVKFRNVRVRAL